MRNTFLFFCAIVLMVSCNEYRYTAKYHEPQTLFDTQKFAAEPSNWDFYVHGKNNQIYKTRSEILDSISFQAVLTKSEPIDVPKGLKRFEYARKKEVHIYAKDSSILFEDDFVQNTQVFDLKKDDIVEVVSYTDPINQDSDDLVKIIITAVSMYVLVIAASLGLAIWLVYTIVNSITSSISSSCFIATMVYGSYDAKEVLILRKFRDEKLKKTILGEIFIANYYVFSPLFVKCFKNVTFVNIFIKKCLDRWVNHLKLKNNW